MGLILAVAAPLQHDADRLRETARDLLSRPPYTTEAPGPVTDVLLRIRSWIAGVLETLFGALAGNRGLAWVAVGLATAVAVTLALRWGRGVRREALGTAAAHGASGRSAADWDREADRYATAGAWADAIRAGYLAVVADLVAEGLLEDVRGLTVGEIDRRVAVDAPDRAAAVASAGRVFEDVRYGHRPADAAGYHRVLAARTDRLAASRS